MSFEKGEDANDDSDNKEQQQVVDDKDPDVLTPQYERNRIKKIGARRPETGETWYAISRKWLQEWEAYTEMKKNDDEIQGGVDHMHEQGKERPGAIDNSELADDKDPLQLKQDIQEHLTHEWIPSEKWDCLHRWYGGGPVFGRNVFEKGTGSFKEKYICQFPKFIRFVTCSPTGEVPSLKDSENITTKGYPKDYLLLQIANEFERKLGYIDEKNEDDVNEPFVHLWTQIKEIVDIYPITSRKVDAKKEQVEAQIKDNLERWVEIPDDNLKTGLDDLKLSDNVIFMIEPKIKPNDNDDNNNNNNSNKWPRSRTEENWNKFEIGDIIDCKDTDGKWYESFIRLIGTAENQQEGKIAVHYIGWATKWDDWLTANDNNFVCKRNTHTKTSHRQKRQRESNYNNNYNSFSWNANEDGNPEQKGIVGLRNLGNTCFMNSTIQCLAQSPWLTEYFLNNDFVHHINRNNPLGWKGKVAEAWAGLLQEMFSNKYRVVAPRAFKQAIGESAPRFMGYAQQDSQELLSFLLDGLHEDLNQIEKKPPTESVESNGRPDKVVALESWKTYLKRNQSTIVDLLQGQYRSKVQCPTCGRISITFDPYMFLSVPLPTEKYTVIEYTYVSPFIQELKVYGEKIFKVADIDMLKKAVAKKFEVPSDELFVCDVWKSRIHRELQNNDAVADINRRNDDIFIFHSPKPKVNEAIEAKEGKDKNANNKNANNNNDNDNNNNNDNNNDNNNNDNNNNNNNNNNNRGRNDDDDDDDDNGHRGNNHRNAGGAGGGGGYNNNNQRKIPDFITCVIVNYYKAKVKQGFQIQARYEDEIFGFPTLITFSIKEKISMAEVRRRIFNLMKPFFANQNFKYGHDELPFTVSANWAYNNSAEIEDKEDDINITVPNLKFALSWKDSHDYRFDTYEPQKRIRDESAPAANNNNNNMGRIGNSYDDEEDGYGKAVTLQQCIDAFTEEETLSENDAWYCASCKDFKCASKQINLWNVPNLLIIHLKRFSYTKAWRDRINTLVKFPIEELNLCDYVCDLDDKNDAIYDLYAVSNHMGGMGGGHYTAYAKNLYNNKWYHLDDSSTSQVNNVNQIISSSAYVLYYKRRNGKQMKQRASRVQIPNLEELNNNKNKQQKVVNKNEE